MNDEVPFQCIQKSISLIKTKLVEIAILIFILSSSVKIFTVKMIHWVHSVRALLLAALYRHNYRFDLIIDQTQRNIVDDN